MPRHCGTLKPKHIESDSDYFRITFKSNEKFDGVGFEAQYQFKKQEGMYLKYNVYTSILFIYFFINYPFFSFV